VGKDRRISISVANGDGEYRRGDDRVLRAHSIHVITTGANGIEGITVFLAPKLFSVFGMPPTR
jgi:RNA polymerase sigma-70 factor (ECF subfamily)